MAVDLDAGDPMAATRSDPTEHLRIKMDELARAFALIADDRRAGLKPVDRPALAPEDRVHRAACQPRLPGEDVRADAELATSGAQAGDELGRVATDLAMHCARAVGQETDLRAVPPLGPGLATNPGGSGSGRDRPARSDPIGQKRPTVRRQPGISMRHEGPFFDCGCKHQQPNDRGPQPVNNLSGNQT